MSEGKSRFKIRKGDTEIEFEGPPSEVNSLYKQAFEWIKSLPVVSPPVPPPEVVGKAKEEKRGGPRKSIYPPKIDELIEEGFFKLPSKKTTSEVIKALQDKGLPVTGKEDVIVNALKRKVQGGKLKGTKTDKEWNFWTE